jgi:arginine decarboxylase
MGGDTKTKLKLNTQLNLATDGRSPDNPIPSPWTIEASESLYRIPGWGEPYFSINAAGHITVSPQGDRGGALDLYELVEALKKRNIGLPLLIRFSDILADRIERINACFARGIARYNYPNVYRGVFPIKCNQHRHIVEALVKYGKPYQFGLEAGSKPELMIALAALEPSLKEKNDKSQALLICNGYKDKEYIETALLATRLGHKPFIVIEQLEELYLAIAISRQLGIEPNLGVRAKLSTKGMGRWGTSTGDRAKFGLTIPEILTVVTELEKEGMLNSLQLLHYHIGSQISAIGVIKDAIREASQIYVQLAKMGANMQYLDVGGGLGVDYDGSKTNFYASKNYNMQNYANDIVAEVKEACEEAAVHPPTLVSESGRAIASHQSVLVFDVLGTSEVPINPPEALQEKEPLIATFGRLTQPLANRTTRKLTTMLPSLKKKPLPPSTWVTSASKNAPEPNNCTGRVARKSYRLPVNRTMSPMTWKTWRRSWLPSTMSICRFSNRFPILGRSINSFPLCRSIA